MVCNIVWYSIVRDNVVWHSDHEFTVSSRLPKPGWHANRDHCQANWRPSRLNKYSDI